MIQAERWLAFARAAAAGVFTARLRAIAARINALNAVALIVSPSCRSMARRVLPSRLALNSPLGSGSAAPLAKVSVTAALSVSPVHRMPLCSHTGTPRHFQVSTTAGSTSWIRRRMRLAARIDLTQDIAVIPMIALMPLLALIDLDMMQLRSLIVIAMLATLVMLFNSRLRHYLLLPSCMALAGGLAAIGLNFNLG